MVVLDKHRKVPYANDMIVNKNITNNNGMPQATICGYLFVSADFGGLASGRDVSNSLLSHQI
jgi:hypothetical protein